MDQERERETLDEYTLAAYLGGTLSPEEREVVEQRLTRDPNARELLCLAQEALEAATDDPLRSTPRPAAARRPAGARPAARRSSRLKRLGQFAGVAILVFALGLSLRVVLGPPHDVLRSQPDPSAMTVEVTPSPALHIQWSPIQDAYEYQLTIWDPVEARVIAEHQTSSSEIAPQDSFTQVLHARLAPAQEYTLRIDAIDAENRLIQRSNLIRFSTAP